MTAHPDALARARGAFQRNEWSEAHRLLSELDEARDLPAEGLELLSTTCFMLGRIDDMISVLERAHHAHMANGDLFPAVRTALWVGINLASRDKFAHASGWLERAHRLMEPVEEDRPERGYMLLPAMFERIASQEYAAVTDLAAEAASIGRRFGDRDLTALAMHVQGRAHLRRGEVREGLRLFDEVMVAVTGGELSPVVTGLVYCSVIEGCHEIREIRRAAEWTAALSDWCDRQPDLVAFTDQCLADRAQIMQLRGTWTEALEQARRAHRRRAQGSVAAQAHYQQGEIHRLRGEFGQAEESYRNVSLNGGDPQPGLAKLRLAQGRIEPAVAAMRRAVSESGDLIRRLAILPAYVEVMVAAGDLVAARSGFHELQEIAGQTGIDMHRAWALHARGLVDLAAGQATEAIPTLREAFRQWEALEVPHEAGRMRLALARALLAVGDEDTAMLELEAARSAFSELGAAPDVRVVDSLAGPAEPGSRDLTPRELEVLRLLSSGDTNRSIAEALFLSERTVDRHVSNIFAKLGVTTRTAATSHAYRHGLV